MSESQAKAYLYFTLGNLYLKVGRGLLTEPQTNDLELNKKRALIALGFIEAGFNLRDAVEMQHQNVE